VGVERIGVVMYVVDNGILGYVETCRNVLRSLGWMEEEAGKGGIGEVE